MNILNGFTDSVGHTPLIRLRQASDETGCEIYGKAEFLNPGGSVKDRAALFMIKDAEERDNLHPGGLIVEGTAGNTGIGLALCANARGYRTLIVIPETQSQEKKDMLRLCGADLKEVPAVPFSNPENYVHVAERLANKMINSEENGVIYANQWDNPANRRAHIEGTGPEILEQTNGNLDGFICAVGTGGTIAGMSIYLKENAPNVKIGIADPLGSSMYSYYTSGKFKSEGNSITEGIGQGRITGNLENIEIDMPFQISDTEALPYVFNLLKNEGLCLGGSSAINIAGAVKMAKEMGPGHTIVTILCDGGTRYQSKLFNPSFLKGKKLPVPDWLDID